MDIQQALIIFDALSQETRLRVFRLLVEAGEPGLPAGELSDAVGTPQNTMSFHLNHLSNAGIVTSRREGRSIIYRANYSATRDLIAYLVQDCCRADAARIWQDDHSGCSMIELADCCAPEESGV